ncbi:transcriptional regulator [Saccharothrix syringae]|uniref:Transcriptional regulator n=2 Tax=Saccharothrix syringae TaxID=103733 RepID=A0A5Q0HF36_SACSY|nr:transcriptional regulator [Saccharothrix syringae]
MIGLRWAGVILRELLRGATRFSQIGDAIPDITDKLLSARLKRFESEGIVERIVLPTTPVTIEYRLTDKGRALEAAVQAIATWAETWLPALAQPDDAAQPDAAQPDTAGRRG